MFVTHRAENGVEYVASSIIKSPHAFSTRIGGASQNSHTAALNLAFNRGDDKDTVIENLTRFGCAAGFEPEKVISLPQIHSATIIRADAQMAGEGYFKDAHTSCDGYVTSEKGVVLGVKTADCVPIVLEAEDEKGEIIAVSALHAGWRGTVAGIAAEGVKKLVEMGAEPKRIRAAIGPAIGSCCFEIGQDVVDEMNARQQMTDVEMNAIPRNGRLYADLKSINREFLVSCGLDIENIDVCGECTFCLEDKYYSHRRMKGVRGTMLSIVFMGKTTENN